VCDARVRMHTSTHIECLHAYQREGGRGGGFTNTYTYIICKYMYVCSYVHTCTHAYISTCTWMNYMIVLYAHMYVKHILHVTYAYIGVCVCVL
jgi:hypothetical protein